MLHSELGLNLQNCALNLADPTQILFCCLNSLQGRVMGSSAESESRADVQGAADFSVLWLMGHHEPSLKRSAASRGSAQNKAQGLIWILGVYWKVGGLSTEIWLPTLSTSVLERDDEGCDGNQHSRQPPGNIFLLKQGDCSPQSLTASTPCFSRGLRTMLWRLKLFQRRNFLSLNLAFLGQPFLFLWSTFPCGMVHRAQADPGIQIPAIMLELQSYVS